MVNKNVVTDLTKQQSHVGLMLSEKEQDIRTPWCTELLPLDFITHQCPDLGAYNRPLKLGMKGSVQTLNAVLALQLCHTWMVKYPERCINNELTHEDQSDIIRITESTASVTTPASQMHVPTAWNQVIGISGVSFYLEGAHTVESIQQCVE
ncbi:hypothetical protein DPMN_152432 [Dreissena polymorpha]|uniref:Uncharacterized protein n=1 Tax=Dreissena polymorpha TaxID=45954 RepID=A0A9D4J7C5_DREPO|nr:hypothetical protein DPMN_152432 [Dreissena polymorpha]